MAARSVRAGIAALAVWGAACGSSTETERVEAPPASAAPAAEGNRLEPPAGRGLVPVPLPDFSAMEGPARQQMTEQVAVVRAKTTDGRTPTGELAQAYGGLGKLFLAATTFDAAEAALLNAQTLAPTDVAWPYYLGQLYRARGPVEKAITEFERALELRPDDLATIMWLGEVQLAQGQIEAAESRFSKGIALQPKLSAAYYGLGRASLAKRDFAAAARLLETSLALEPRAGGIHYQLAQAYRGLGDTARANLHLGVEGKLEPRAPDPLMSDIDNLLNTAEAHNVRGGHALDLGAWDQAAEHFRAAIALAPNDGALHHRLGTALAQAGDTVGAAAAFRRALELAPGHARAHFSLGLLAAAEGRREEAIQRLSDAVKYEPGYAPAHTQLGSQLARLGRYTEAEAAFKSALALVPGDADAAFGRAMLAVRQHQYAPARDQLAQWALDHPEHLQFRHALARLFAAAPDAGVRDGRRAKAIVDELMKGQQSLELGETAAMMLAENRDFQQAAVVQRDLIAAAEKARLTAVAARLRANLQRYERGEPVREPFSEAELP